MMAEPQTRVHELTTADLAGQVEAQRQPEGPSSSKVNNWRLRPCSLNRKWESSDHVGATLRRGSWMSRGGPSKTLTSLSRR